MNDLNHYEAPQKNWWTGRNDGKAAAQKRWWQRIQYLDLQNLPDDLEKSPVFLGFACDEGVRRNKGRPGAVAGPMALRQACCNLPNHFPATFKLCDAGNITCPDRHLEKAQEALAAAINEILNHEGFPILAGGGHEILYGHFQGVSRHFKNKKIGILNLDAHFDLRKPGKDGPSSGTGFYQIAADCKAENKNFYYLAMGIQKSGNTKELFDLAHQLKVKYILAEDLVYTEIDRIQTAVKSFLDQIDLLCLTIDMDVFSSSIAPGVSAPTAAGLFYDRICREILKETAQSGKVVSFDIAELNPKWDRDGRTSKLGAQILFDWMQ